MLKLTIVLFCVLFCRVHCQEKGEPCLVENKPGICKSVFECEFARKILLEDERKPTMCMWEDNVRIVCCPLADLFHVTGVFKQYFVGTDDGVKRSKTMTCRYDGKQPLTCCENLPDLPPPPEPQDCPAIHRPALSFNTGTPEKRASAEIYRTAWEKCLDYQRYLQVCVSTDDNPDEYERKTACGIPTNKFRVSGGTPARPKEFPHMALLGCHNGISTDDVDIVWVAGGSLISDKFVLTAGHTLLELTHGLVRYVLLGSLHKQDTQNGTIYNVIRRIPYPTYISNVKKDDLALLELDRRVKLSEFVRPACLPVPGLTYEKKLIIAGWGEVDDRGGKTEVLLTTDVTKEDGSMCGEKLQSKSFTWNDQAMICAAGKINKRGTFSDSCKGDSGGPLMSVISESIIPCTYAVRGVVSFGPNCGNGQPGVYTNVAYEPYMTWIVNNVWLQVDK